jgi:hypothetical protein
MDMFAAKESSNGQMVRDVEKGPIGYQLLLNYCFGHPQSTLLICPYGSGVNYINHNQTMVNVKIQWAPNGHFNHDSEWLKTSPDDMFWEHSTKLAMEFVALRDIKEGEEIFLDYGDEWEAKWQKHIEAWQSAPDRREYISSHQMNLIHVDDSIRTKEEQELDPYPENVAINCHSALKQSFWEELVEEAIEAGTKPHDDPLEYIERVGWSRDYKGYPCAILERDDENNEYSVALQYLENGEWFEERVQDVPRKAIVFVDMPYTTDMHLLDTFRYPIGIPDGIMPAAWENRHGMK